MFQEIALFNSSNATVAIARSAAAGCFFWIGNKSEIVVLKVRGYNALKYQTLIFQSLLNICLEAFQALRATKMFST